MYMHPRLYLNKLHMLNDTALQINKYLNYMSKYAEKKHLHENGRIMQTLYVFKPHATLHNILNYRSTAYAISIYTRCSTQGNNLLNTL